eukprot:SAG11_NODE_17039_length_530_cov_1.157773_1_plen_26_part_01
MSDCSKFFSLPSFAAHGMGMTNHKRV